MLLFVLNPHIAENVISKASQWVGCLNDLDVIKLLFLLLVFLPLFLFIQYIPLGFSYTVGPLHQHVAQ